MWFGLWEIKIFSLKKKLAERKFALTLYRSSKIINFAEFLIIKALYNEDFL
jgi:hypothetical protein